jgi:hypothetical protein
MHRHGKRMRMTRNRKKKSNQLDSGSRRRRAKEIG